MRHPRCQSANSNCGGLNLRLPRCMLWPSETLSPLFSLPVSASGRCVSVRLSHVAPQRYSPWAGRVRSVQHGSQVGVPSGFSAVRRFRVSTVRSSRSRRALSSVIGGGPSVTDRESRDGRSQSTMYFLFRRPVVAKCGERHGERASFISHFECKVGLNHMPRSPDAPDDVADVTVSSLSFYWSGKSLDLIFNAPPVLPALERASDESRRPFVNSSLLMDRVLSIDRPCSKHENTNRQQSELLTAGETQFTFV